MESFETQEDGRDDLTSVRVAYSNLPPFVEIKTENGREIIDGFMPAIMRAVTSWMHLNVTWIREPGNKYGSWNGTEFTGMRGMLHRNEVDFIVNPVIPTYDDLTMVEFLNPIIYEAFTILSGKETQDAGLFLYFSVLDKTVWISLGVALIVVAFTSALLFLRVSSHSFCSAMAEYMWVYVSFTLGQVPNDGKWTLRKSKSPLAGFIPLLKTLWVIGVTFLIMSVFQSLLFSQLAIVKHYPVVDSLDEFVRKKQVIGLTPKEIDLHLALTGLGIPVYDKTWEKLEPELIAAAEVFSDESLKNVQKGGYCIFHGHLILRSILSDYFKKKGTCNFHLSENMFFPFPLLVAIRKTLPKKFKGKLNMGVTRLVDADLTGKWFKTIYDICHSCITYSETDVKPLTLNNVYGVLMLWGLGMISAAVGVLAEIIHFKCSLKKLHRKRKRTCL